MESARSRENEKAFLVQESENYEGDEQVTRLSSRFGLTTEPEGISHYPNKLGVESLVNWVTVTRRRSSFYYKLVPLTMHRESFQSQLGNLLLSKNSNYNVHVEFDPMTDLDESNS